MTARRVAQALWIAWAVVVWNVIFDRVIVVAGRAYLAAVAGSAGSGTYPRMDDWMRPAVARGLSLATLAAGLILVVGFVAIRKASAPARTTPD
jgi:hypothetical protein